MKTPSKINLIAASAFLSLGNLATAATVATTVLGNDETQIINTGGTLISAYSFGDGTDLTINGILHTGGTSPAFAPGFQGNFRNATNAGFTGIMFDLMRGIAGRSGSQIDMAITGLTVGQEYLFQGYWEGRSDQTLTVTFEGTDSAPGIVGGANPGSGNFGALVSYQFVATDDTLNVDWDKTGADNIWIQGYSLQAIPEPSTALLGGIGMLLLMRRRRQG